MYFEPIWVNNTNQLPRKCVDHNDTFLLGIGGRFRVRPTVYVVAEIAPRAPASSREATPAASPSKSAPADTRSR